jgi:hypothetical protein
LHGIQIAKYDKIVDFKDGNEDYFAIMKVEDNWETILKWFHEREEKYFKIFKSIVNLYKEFLVTFFLRQKTK